MKKEYEVPQTELVEANLGQMLASSPGGIPSDDFDMPIEKLF